MAYHKIKFPCGLIHESSGFMYFWGDNEDKRLWENGCPIHGKNCPQKK